MSYWHLYLHLNQAMIQDTNGEETVMIVIALPIALILLLYVMTIILMKPANDLWTYTKMFFLAFFFYWPISFIKNPIETIKGVSIAISRVLIIAQYQRTINDWTNNNWEIIGSDYGFDTNEFQEMWAKRMKGEI